MGYKKVFGNGSWVCRCERCGHVWTPREKEVKPRVCPNQKCHSAYWDTSKKELKD